MVDQRSDAENGQSGDHQPCQKDQHQHPGQTDADRKPQQNVDHHCAWARLEEGEETPKDRLQRSIVDRHRRKQEVLHQRIDHRPESGNGKDCHQKWKHRAQHRKWIHIGSGGCQRAYHPNKVQQRWPDDNDRNNHERQRDQNDEAKITPALPAIRRPGLPYPSTLVDDQIEEREAQPAI